jgi:hypothetical protein
VLEAAVHHGAQALGLEDEVLEAGGVDSYVVTLGGILGDGGGCDLLLFL